MTEPQERALALAFLLLEAEFDHAVIAVRDKERPGLLIQEDFEVAWTGGQVMAMDLASRAVKRIDYRRTTRCPPNVSKNIMDEVVAKPNGEEPNLK